MRGSWKSEIDFKLVDYAIFSIATIKDSNQTFLGILGSWFLISSPSEVNPTELQQVSAGNQGDQTKSEAIQAKGRKEYYAAGDLFYRASLKYQESASKDIHSSSFMYISAGQCLEEAYKCYSMANYIAKGIECLQRAVEIYEQYDGGSSRAARICENLAGIYNKTGEHRDLRMAHTYFFKAAQLFELENDTRWIGNSANVANLQCEIQDYEAAFLTFSKVLEASNSEKALSFRCTEYLFNQGLCIVGIQDWVRLVKFLDGTLETYPFFFHSREYTLLRNMIEAVNNNDPTEWSDYISEFSRLSMSALSENWKQTVLKKQLNAFEIESLT